MAACTSTIPDMNSWKLKRKRPSDYERLETGKSRKIRSFVKENGFNNSQTSSSNKDQSAKRPLSDITREAQAQKPTEDLDENTSSDVRDIIAVGSDKSVVESPTGDKTVTYVNNLFSPVNKLQAIPLSLNELRRRTEYPEYFGRSEMVSYLRHSKTTGNELIARYNLKPKSKHSHVNVLSRLCEREARTLANGIHQMNSEYFPTDYVADTMKTHMQRERVLNEEDQTEGDKTTDSDNKETIKSTMCMLQSLKKSLQEPDEKLAKDLEVFERATHTFGCQNILNHISFVESYLSELQKKL